MKWLAFQPLVGGMMIGARDAFLSSPECILSYEGFYNNDRHAVNYFNVEYKNPKDYKNEKDIDVVVAVPICSGLSQLNSCKDGNKARGCDAEQNNNMYDISEFTLKNISPKALICENAPNLFTQAGEKVVNNLYNIAKKYNYSITFYKTSTMFHGLPQNRQRTFFIFWKSEFAPIMSWYNRETDNFYDFMIKNSDEDPHQIYTQMLQSNLSYGYIKMHIGDSWRQYMIQQKYPTAIDYIKANDLFDDFVDYCKIQKDERWVKCAERFKYKMKILGKNAWNNTVYIIDKFINSINGMSIRLIVHPFLDRLLTHREILRLMGHPEDFSLQFSSEEEIVKNLNVVAQNVPVCTSRDICLEVKKFLNDELIFSDKDFIKQNNILQKTIL